MYCQNCGKKNEDNAIYCEYCGVKIANPDLDHEDSFKDDYRKVSSDIFKGRHSRSKIPVIITGILLLAVIIWAGSRVFMHKDKGENISEETGNL